MNVSRSSRSVTGSMTSELSVVRSVASKYGVGNVNGATAGERSRRGYPLMPANSAPDASSKLMPNS